MIDDIAKLRHLTTMTIHLFLSFADFVVREQFAKALTNLRIWNWINIQSREK
jgi:hypothetical protein